MTLQQSGLECPATQRKTLPDQTEDLQEAISNHRHNCWQTDVNKLVYLA